MEETKCRLALEAELQELRMRLASAEVAATRAPYSGAAPPLPAAADGASGFGGLPGGDFHPGAAAAAAFDQAVRASLPASPPRCEHSGAGGGGGACWSAGVEQAVRSRMKEPPWPARVGDAPSWRCRSPQPAGRRVCMGVGGGRQG